MARVRDELQSEFEPDGFNVGLNDGRAAGQTVGHAHVHVIPRFDGDVVDARGGIRWAYGQAHHAGRQVWVQSKELRLLSDDWRRILSAA